MIATTTWPAGPEHPVLGVHTVDVWRLDLDSGLAAQRGLQSLLDAEEVARAARFRFDVHRVRFIARRGLLRRVLARYLDSTPQRLRFTVNPYGKPALAEPAETDIRFNLSHSDNIALLAVGVGREVGVDIERIRRAFAAETIPEQFFSPAEVADLRAQPPAVQDLAFFQAWTRKEAYIKARGEGLSRPLNSFDVALAPGRPAALLATRPDAADAERWRMFGLDIAADYVAALVVEGGDCTARCWRYSAK